MRKKWLRAPYGFSLIELLVVLFIISILSSLIALNIGILSTTHAPAELNLLHACMVTCQQKAIASGKQQSMHFLVAENGYRSDNQTHYFAKKVRFGIVETVKGPPSHPITLLNAPVTFSNNTVIFYPDGIITAGTVYLVDHRKKLYALSSGVGNVSFLRKYRYDDAWKLMD